ncbi:DEAD/DEAH box helicase, partial [Bradyrhizobium centrolobii]|uniref:DEAD/DEAH box helicase n=1 Tax=Bradyrhizobium centrolobii TaxID=1505087 RepID=UPI003221F128
MPPRTLKTSAEPAALLPDRFQAWFSARGWSPRAHQLALLKKAREDRSALLIAPTGAGKTLAGFLPTLVELSSEGDAARSSPQAQPAPPSLRGRSTLSGARSRAG